MNKENTILLTDDDKDDQQFIIETLVKKGFNGAIKIFENGAELTDYLYTTGLTDSVIILLDLNMPLKSGYETLKEIKEHHRLKTIPVFIITCSQREEDKQYCLKTGCEQFFSKPNTVNQYNNIVDAILSFANEKAIFCQS